MHILINGFNGNMGQAIQAQCKQFDIIAFDFQAKAKDLNHVSAVIDFSSPTGFISCINFCIEHKLPLISGTTGLTKEHLSLISTAKKSIPILIASNMSLGIANLKYSIEEYLLSINISTKCRITEIHHTKKKDSPSGTALEISRFLENMLVSRIDCPIEIQSHRIGNVFGMHRIEFTNADGTSTFQHIANSRNIFAKGALQAARWIDSRESGEYSFADFLNKKL
ncbi:4-hydroxy-tetrahydrodipicolinate reductase [Gammaproteobacteria bacterium]|nr:4-hydroxy-tetrahydrodipicolinate reductase [Gammaproteobacteria bacterium]MDA8799393.1 4-hydroxy-tetrahydrodipicolinate reductase [Gammaproteobacteria bacterium]MDC0918933.1 dihydrodipicolinate reductase C-terminal domain-containing protein [Gammaproteobacteria bacterium]